MGLRFSTSATASSGTKAASHPRKKHRGPRKYVCCTAVEEASVEVIESFGKYHRIARPGFNYVWCCLGQSVAGRLSTRLQHQEVQCECKTRDGVFVELVFSVQYRVAEDRLYSAFYSLSNPAAQVTSYVLDAVGTAVASMEVEDVFSRKGDIVWGVRQGLVGVLGTHGFAVEDCLITVLTPTASVKEAMSGITAARRQREAAFEEGEADKLRKVKGVEASAESKYLQGQGLARFLVALAAGVRDSIKVLVTGRITREQLKFPDPPPGNDAAALAAAGVLGVAQQPGEENEVLEGGQERGGAQHGALRQEGTPSLTPEASKRRVEVASAAYQKRKAPVSAAPGHGAGGLTQSMIQSQHAAGAAESAPTSSAVGYLGKGIGQPALLAPHTPAMPSRGGAPAAAGLGKAAKASLAL